MIRAENLMIGDLVKFPYGIDKVCDLPYVEGKGICASFAASATLFPVPVEALEPIPLTPEILEKNGFVNDNSVYGVRYRWESEDTRTEIRIYSPQDGYSGMTIIKNSYLVDEVSYDLPDVYMVHELQHALKLCGIDLEINI